MSITVECLGDPIYYDNNDDWYPDNPSDDPDYELIERPIECDGKRKIYTLDKLPGKEAVFIIKSGGLSIELIYCFWSLSKRKLVEFCEAMSSNNMKSLYFKPGSNSNAEISTSGGMTTFRLVSAEGDDPCEIKFNVPNSSCIEAFRNLIKYD